MSLTLIRLAPMFVGLVLAGCGSGASEPSSQTAVLVNQQEVSVHQLQHALQTQPRLSAEAPELATRKVLDALVEQELAAQAARSDGIDKDPRFVQAFEAARRELLARSYQDRLAERAVGPSSDAIDRYYDAHPGLFAQRRLYTLQETTLRADAAMRARLAQVSRTARDPKEFAELIKGSGGAQRTRQFVQAAEDLPMGLVEALARFEEGQSLVVNGNETARIVTVVRFQLAPLDKRAAKDMIEAHLLNEQRRRLVAEGMRTLRDKATIQYASAFAPVASAAASSPIAP